MFFKYGFRINPDIVKDEQGSPNWRRVSREAPHSTKSSIGVCPIGLSGSSHPIVKNLGGIKFDFANPIDTLKNGIKKTLLKSSQYSRKLAPVEII
jgi:hypothetical protein